jgi:predicted RND superfamily exporter protein
MTAGPPEIPARAARYVAFIRRRWGAVLLVAGLFGALGVAGAARLKLRAEVSELLPRGDKGVEGLKAVADRVGGVVTLIVAVEGPDPAANRRFADDLVKRLRTFPPEEIRAIDYRVDDARRFVDAHKWLYLDLKELQDLRCALETQIRRFTHPAFVPLEECPSLETIEKHIRERIAGADRFPSGYVETPDQKMLAVVIWPHSTGWGEPVEFALVGKVRDEIAKLGPKNYNLNMTANLTGDLPVMLDEHEALKSDLALVTILCIVLVFTVIAVYFRQLRAVYLVFAPTLTATLVAFGAAGVAIGYLNTNTAFLGSIIVGNGINPPIILLARYREERARGRSVDDAFAVAIHETIGATIVASLAAAGAYGSLVITAFRGFNQFGLIGLVGMALCWAAAYTMGPALVMWLEKVKPSKVATHEDGLPTPVAGLMARIVLARPRALLVAGAALVAAAVIPIARIARDPYEYNLRRLRNERTATAGAGALMERLKAAFARGFTPTLAIVPKPEDAAAVAKALRERDAARAAGSPDALLVGEVHWLDELVPPDQDAKMEELHALRKVLTGSLMESLEDEDKKKIDPYIPPADLKTFTRNDLPATAARPFTEVDGTRGRIVLAYFRPDRDMFDSRLLLRFADLGHALPIPGDGTVDMVGRNTVWADMLKAIERDGPRASLTAFLVVTFLVVVLFRKLGPVLSVLSSLAAGTVLTAGLAALTGERLNFLNFVAIPITLGVGVDYAANLVHRMRREGPRGRPGLMEGLRGTGGAMALCSSTTIIGYGSLLVAGNLALRSFGWLCALGEVCCLGAALTLVPAGAALLFRKKGAGVAAPTRAGEPAADETVKRAV